MSSFKSLSSTWHNSLLLTNIHSHTNLLLIYNYTHVKNIVENFFNLTIKSEDDHFHHLLEFCKDIKNLGYQLMSEQGNCIAKYLPHVDLSIFFDYTALTKSQVYQIKSKNNKTKIILSLTENPFYLDKVTDNFFLDFDDIHSTYDINYQYNKTDTAYIYKSIPWFPSTKKKPKLDVFSEVFDSSLINSNLHSFSSLSHYSLRRKLINICSNINKFDFRWYGRGWMLNNISKVNRQNWRYVKSDILSAPRLSNKAKKQYCGKIKDKSILTKCKSSFAIENICWPSNYYTEKLFEPLEYNCIPIFFKTNNLNNRMLNEIKSSEFNVFISTKPLEMVNIALDLSKLELEETQSIAFRMRMYINKYLEANNYNTNLCHCFKAIEDMT